MRETTGELIAENRFKSFWIRHYQKLNELIQRFQDYVGGIYQAYFTFYGALLFSMSAGACISFIDGIHGHCEGKIELNSPLSYFLIMLVCFFIFQTFLLVPLTGGRLLRLLGVGLCGHYLAYQTYGFWSLQNIDSIASCKPYTYANITYGYMWAFIPALILITICFFVGNLESEIESNNNY